MDGREFTRELKCKLSEDEVHAKGAMLAALCRELEHAKQTKKEVMSSHNAVIKDIEKRINEARDARETGTEMRTVDCYEQYTKQNTVEVIRKDTGDVVETRVMTDAERQTELNLKKAKKAQDEFDDLLGSKPKKDKAKKDKPAKKQSMADRLREMLKAGPVEHDALSKSEKAAMRRLKGKGVAKRDDDGDWVQA